MGKYLLVAPSAARPGREDEFDAWYDDVHLADVCAIPGVLSGKRYNAHPGSPAPVPGPRLAIYELELDDPAQFFAELSRRSRSGEMKLTDTIDPGSAQLWLYEHR